MLVSDSLARTCPARDCTLRSFVFVCICGWERTQSQADLDRLCLELDVDQANPLPDPDVPFLSTELHHYQKQVRRLHLSSNQLPTASGLWVHSFPAGRLEQQRSSTFMMGAPAGGRRLIMSGRGLDLYVVACTGRRAGGVTNPKP